MMQWKMVGIGTFFAIILMLLLDMFLLEINGSLGDPKDEWISYSNFKMLLDKEQVTQVKIACPPINAPFTRRSMLLCKTTSGIYYKVRLVKPNMLFAQQLIDKGVEVEIVSPRYFYFFQRGRDH